MAHRTASKPILSLRSLSEVCGKDFFNRGSASAQWPLSASFAARSVIAVESADVAGFLATWAWVTGAIRTSRRLVKIVLKRWRIKKKKGRHSSCLPSQSTLRLRLEEELQGELYVALALRSRNPAKTRRGRVVREDIGYVKN